MRPTSTEDASDVTTTYTTAPADYDWWFTRDLGPAGTIRGKTVRKVEVNRTRVDEQCGRYASGCHMAVDEAEWQKLVAYKLAVAIPVAKSSP